MKLTDQGRRLSARWKSSPQAVEQEGVEDVWTTWTVTVARYERTGRPRIQPGSQRIERQVVLPGRWVRNQDGELVAVVDLNLRRLWPLTKTSGRTRLASERR
jgi:hypothetical protein